MTEEEPAVDNWSTPLGLGWCAAAGTVIAAVLAATSAIPVSRLFWIVAALAFAAATFHILRARPRLAADSTGITARGTLHSYRWNHGQVRVVLRNTRRLGRENTLLELDGIDVRGEERLLLFGRFDLGADPVDVHETLTALRTH